ncbi:MAG: RHS repeat-associated core domain-containing protein [Proteobacteria bacterium]|nr:RHS repeat-associated core domain-containing protein [Pseudomonadota bacterium]
MLFSRLVTSISLLAMLGGGFAASLPQVNIAASAKAEQIKQTQNTITYDYAGDTPLKLSGYSNSVGSYNEGIKPLQYNAQNEVISDDHGNALSYDALGEMLEFENSQTGEQVNYQYDAESHQSAESILNNKGEVQNSQSFYYSTGDKAQMIAESDSDGNQLSYLFAETKIGSINNSDEASLYITDQAGSVVTLVSNSQLSHEYVYSLYGIETDLDQSTTKAKNAQGFDGQRTDKATGYQFLGNGYRAYNPILHRFMQMDDISYSPFGKGGINGYVFGNNNPVMNFDPSGHSILGILANILVVAAIITLFPMIPFDQLLDGFVAEEFAESLGSTLASTIGGGVGQASQIGIDMTFGEYHPNAGCEIFSAVAGGFATGVVGGMLDGLGNRLLANTFGKTQDWGIVATKMTRGSVYAVKGVLMGGVGAGVSGGVMTWSTGEKFNTDALWESALIGAGAGAIEYTFSVRKSEIADNVKSAEDKYLSHKDAASKVNTWERKLKGVADNRIYKMIRNFIVHPATYVADDVGAIIYR